MGFRGFARPYLWCVLLCCVLVFAPVEVVLAQATLDDVVNAIDGTNGRMDQLYDALNYVVYATEATRAALYESNYSVGLADGLLNMWSEYGVLMQTILDGVYNVNVSKSWFDDGAHGVFLDPDGYSVLKDTNGRSAFLDSNGLSYFTDKDGKSAFRRHDNNNRTWFEEIWRNGIDPDNVSAGPYLKQLLTGLTGDPGAGDMDCVSTSFSGSQYNLHSFDNVSVDNAPLPNLQGRWKTPDDFGLGDLEFPAVPNGGLHGNPFSTVAMGGFTLGNFSVGSWGSVLPDWDSFDAFIPVAIVLMFVATFWGFFAIFKEFGRE